MPLETFNFIDSLNASNPVGATDQKQQGDDHIRGIKSTILATFPNIAGAVTLTHTQINNAAIKTEANTFQANQVIESTAPAFTLNESDASVDEGRWKLVASGDQFFGQARNDADNAGSTWLQMSRTGTVINTLDLTAANVRLRAGSDLNIFDSDNSHSMRVDHDGTDANIRFENGITTDLNLDISQALSGQFKVFVDTHFVSGSAVQIRDAANTDTATFSHDGTDFNTAFVGTANWDISGLTGKLNLQNNIAIQMAFTGAASLTEMFRFSMDRPWIFQTFSTGASNALSLKSVNDGKNFHITQSDNNHGFAFNLSTGGSMFYCYSPTSTANYLRSRHDGSRGHIETATGEIRMNAAGGEVIRLIGSNTGDANSVYMSFYDSAGTTRHGFVGDGTGGASTISLISDLGGISLNSNLTAQTLDLNDLRLTTDNDNADEVGFKGAPHNVENGNYTLALTDAGKTVRKESGGSGETYTIPPNSSVAFPEGTIIVVHNDGGGNLTIAQGSGVTLEQWNGSTGNKTLGDNNKAILEKVATNTWKYSATD